MKKPKRRVAARPASPSGLILVALFVASCWLLLAPACWQAAALKLNDTRQRQEQQQLIRVAAFASRLEQWFICRRANQLSDQLESAAAMTGSLAAPEQQQQQQPSQMQQLSPMSPASQPARCAAHFDGHLCWPASEAGARLQLACPRLNWSLVGGQPPQRAAAAGQLRSVINSIQPQVVDNQTRELPQQANSSSSLQQQQQSFVLGESAATTSSSSSSSTSSGDSSQAQAPKFAYRTCAGNAGARQSDQQQSPAEHKNGDIIALGVQQQQQQRQPTGWLTNEADYSQCNAAASSTSMSGHDEADSITTTSFDPADQWIKLELAADRRLFERLQEELDRIEGAIDPYADPDLLQQWTLCIGNIMLDEQRRPTTNHSAQPGGGDLWCPIIFDGWRCWPSTRASEVAYVSCPSNQPGFSAERKAHKICLSDGTWYKHPMTNRYWSNYTTCVDTVDLAFRTKILNLYVIGNLISLVALSASLIIFISFKSLNCTRVTIHKNLFLSFITNNLMWIIWYTCVVNDANLLQSNPIGCQLWHILLHYFLVSNYFWMFCEGLYLHTLLVVAFVSENKILKWFYLLGWLTPIPITIAYAYNRSYDEYYTNFCWMEESPYNLILMAPIGISLLLNLVFLINIVRVLVTKLRANNSPDTHQTRKAVRATLILIPLLGLHYMLTPFRPEAKSEWEVIYEIVAAVCTSFQGLCVAMLFCFCNAEVIAVIKKKLKDTFLAKQSRRFSSHPHQHHQMRNRSNTLLVEAAAAATHSSQNHSGRFNSIAAPYCSSGSNFDLKPSPATSIKNAQRPNGQDPLANNHSSANNLIKRSNGSNSSSLLTTVTASPVCSGADSAQTTAGSPPLGNHVVA